MKKIQTIAPVRPSAGLEAAYRAKLNALIDAMERSMTHWLEAAYRANLPEMAQDAAKGETPTTAQLLAAAIKRDGSPARVLQAVMKRLGKTWQKKFDVAASELGGYFATAVGERVDGQLQKILKKSGFAVEGFKMTAAMNDVLQAETLGNVMLISNLAEQHIAEVQGAVMRSVASGRDLSTLSDELIHRFGILRRRAALISRDQNNKATATVARVRQTELGITKALWLHSAGGKTPRRSHVAYSGKEYDVQLGAEIDGEFILPGQLINCRCVSRPIIPGLPRRAAA